MSYNKDVLAPGDLILLGTNFGIICCCRRCGDEFTFSRWVYDVLWPEGGETVGQTCYLDKRFNTWFAITVVKGVLELLSTPPTHPENNL